MKTAEQDHGWRRVRFPSRGTCQNFLAQVHVWSDVEALPTIEVEPLPDGRRLRYRTRDPRRRGCVHRLIESYGGHHEAPPAPLPLRTSAA